MGEISVGIDLGTTTSAIGVVDSGFPLVLADEAGKRIMPSAVFLGEDGTVGVGRKALRRRAVDGARVITSVKRWMGRESGIPADLSHVGKSPEEISALILGELKRVAEWRLGQSIHKAVITVPAYFHDGQRQATKRAGELAGLEVVRIINEPTAAALCYGLNQLGALWCVVGCVCVCLYTYMCVCVCVCVCVLVLEFVYVHVFVFVSTILNRVSVS